MSGKRAKQSRREAKEKNNSSPMPKVETNWDDKFIPEMEEKKPKKKVSGLKLSRAKDLFNFGALNRALITPEAFNDGWCILLSAQDGSIQRIESDRGTERVFKTLDAAFKVAHEIGFEEVQVVKAK